MKTLVSGLQDHLDTGATTLAMCWKVTRSDAQVFGFTEHDKALSFDGVTYEADSAFDRTQISQSLGLAVDNHDVMGALSSDALDPDDIAEGRWDGAEITVYLVNWRDVAMRQTLYRGQIGRMTRGDLAFKAEVRSLVDRLNQKTGRVYGFFCDTDFGSDRCGVDATSATYTATGTVAASPAPSRRSFVLSGVSGYDDGWFSSGKVTLTSGPLSGLAREIKTHTLAGSINTIELWEGFPAAPDAGVSFSVVAGCDKSWATCRAKFSNGANFQGFPHMPGNDRVTDYPREGEQMDGGSLFENVDD